MEEKANKQKAKNQQPKRMIRTDLANEALEYCPDAKGVISEQETPYTDIEITRVEIQNAKGVRALGKPIGNYITIDANKLLENEVDYVSDVTKTVSTELLKLLNKNGNIEEKDTILIVGLGNQKITPDSLGPKVSAKVLVSRHITQYLPEIIDERARPVCSIAPGVLGITGIETAEVVAGIVKRIHPKAIIAIDSLASRCTQRISTAIQITDTGIIPGGGIGNKRMELSKKTLGTTVIAMGIPMVVHASTISQDAVELLFSEIGEEGDHEFKENLIRKVGELMSESVGELVVTPKDIDKIVEDSSTLLANSIDMALHKVSLDEIRSLA